MQNEKENAVFLCGSVVRKTYHSGRHAYQRFRKEYRALNRLEPVKSIPRILEFDVSNRVLVMQRIDGIPLSQAEFVTPDFLWQLQVLVDAVIAAGVARHALPLRDILVQPDGTPALVDFERCTLKLVNFGPCWNIAKFVTRLHFLRVVKTYHPENLSNKEKTFLRVGDKVERLHKAFRKIKDRMISKGLM